MSQSTNNPYPGLQCPFCGASGAGARFSARSIRGLEHTYYYCPDCHSIFLWPFPGADSASGVYDVSYYGEKAEKFRFPGVEKALDIFRSGRAKRLVKLTRGKGKVLDIGCGSGRFLHLLGRRGDYTLLGSELPGPPAARAARFPEIRLSVGAEFHPEVEASSLDAVTMFHVIEHLEDPAGVIKKISESLKPGGYFYVSFPNIHSWQGRRFRGDWLHLDPPRHLVLFHPDHFEQFMQKSGFEKIHRSGFSIEQNPFGMVQSLLNRMTGHRDLLFESMKGNKHYASKVSPAALLLHKVFFLLSFPVFILTDLLMSISDQNATVTFVFRKSDPMSIH